VEPAGISRAEPSGRLILNISDMGTALSGRIAKPQPLVGLPV
jgi:hypothetical protein